MKWQILPESTMGDSEVHYLDSDVHSNATTEVYLSRKVYVVNFALGDSIIPDKTRKFKTLPAAKKYAQRWFTNHIKNQIKTLQSILDSK